MPVNATPTAPGDLPPQPVPPPILAKPVKRWRWWVHLLLVSAYILAVGVLGLRQNAAHEQMPALPPSPGGLLMVCAFEVLSFGIVLGLAWLASRASRDDLLLRWRLGFWPVPLGIGYSIALRIAVAMLMVAVCIVLLVAGVVTPQSLKDFASANRPNVEAVVDISAMRSNPLYYWLMLTVLSFVVAGLREELWRSSFLAGMRALWPRHFGSRVGQVAAVAIAAMVFGFGHFRMGLLAVLMTGLLGFGLGLIMVFHRSIWPAVIAHGMFDATSLALLPWVADMLKGIRPAVGP